MDQTHSEIAQKNSIESMESGYGSVGNITKCDICETFCTEPIVVWFSNSGRQKTETNTSNNNESERPGSSLVSAANVCNGCFAENSSNMAEKLKKKSRIQGYRPASIINMSPSAMNHEEVERGKSTRRRDRLTCSVIAFCALILVVILFVLFVILISTGTLQSPSSSTENESTQSAALVQNMDDLQIKYIGLLEKLKTLTNQTIKYQNEVDVTLANHTAALLELSRHVNNTGGAPTTSGEIKLDGNAQCNYYKPRQRTSAAVSETRTPWYPAEEDSDVTITGVECSVKGGVSSQLETRQVGSFTQYSCVCPAQTNTGSLIHTCAIHFWSCTSPSISQDPV